MNLHTALAAWAAESASVERAEAFWNAALAEGVPCQCHDARDPNRDNHAFARFVLGTVCGFCSGTGRVRDPAMVVEWWLPATEVTNQRCWRCGGTGKVCAECGKAWAHRGVEALARSKVLRASDIECRCGSWGSRPCGCAFGYEYQPRLPAMRMLDWWERYGRENPTCPAAAAIDALLTAAARIETPCPACGGFGELLMTRDEDGEPYLPWGPCERCLGTGREPCPACDRDPDNGRTLGVFWQRLTESLDTCWLCCGSGALPLLAPGICRKCKRPSEAHRRSLWIQESADEGSRLVCQEKSDFESRLSSFASDWPRKEQ